MSLLQTEALRSVPSAIAKLCSQDTSSKTVQLVAGSFCQLALTMTAATFLLLSLLPLTPILGETGSLSVHPCLPSSHLHLHNGARWLLLFSTTPTGFGCGLSNLSHSQRKWPAKMPAPSLDQDNNRRNSSILTYLFSDNLHTC